jgi:hypothetical protein
VTTDSPAGAKSFDIARTLRTVLLAMLPGIVVAIWFLGLGVLFNIVLAALFALMFEALALWLNAPVNRGTNACPPFEKGGLGGISRASRILQSRKIPRSRCSLPPFSKWARALTAYLKIIELPCPNTNQPPLKPTPAPAAPAAPTPTVANRCTTASPPPPPRH